MTIAVCDSQIRASLMKELDGNEVASRQSTRLGSIPGNLNPMLTAVGSRKYRTLGNRVGPEPVSGIHNNVLDFVGNGLLACSRERASRFAHIDPMLDKIGTATGQRHGLDDRVGP